MKPLVLILERSRLVAVNEQQVFAPLSFTSEVIAAMEVKNSEKLNEAVTAWLTEQKIEGGKAVLIVGDELVFKQPVVAQSDKTETFAQQQKFREALPFHAQDLLISELPSTDKEKHILLAVNGELCREVVDAVEKNKIKVEHVVPGAVVGVAGSDAVASAEVGTIIKLCHKAPSPAQLRHRFPQPAPQTSVATNSDKTKVKKITKTTTLFGLTLPLWVAWLLIAGIFIVPLVVIGGTWLQSQQKQPTTQEAKTDTTQNSDQSPVNTTVSSSPSAETTLLSQASTPSGTSTASATVVAPVSASEKSQLTISILNGSGVVGQAGLVKNALVQEGYPAGTTANATGTNLTNTTVTFQATVSASVRSDVVSILETIFSEITVSEPDPDTAASVTILTGQGAL